MVTKIEGGKVAYEAYCTEVGGVSVRGDELWPWERMCTDMPRVAHAWRCAAAAVLALTFEETP